MKMTLSKFWRTTMNSTLNISQKALMCPTFYYEKSSLFFHYALKKAFRTLGHFISTIMPRERKIYIIKIISLIMCPNVHKEENYGK